VVETKLLPLLLDCPDDTELIVTVTKILVLLTLPLSPTTRRYARLHATPSTSSSLPSSSSSSGFDPNKRRLAARAQNFHLLKMKKALTHPGLIAVLVSALEEPLAKGGTGREGGREERKEEDTLLIELVLTLLRNLLCIEDVTMEGGREGGREGGLLQAELLLILEKEYVLDILLYLCQGVQAKENEGKPLTPSLPPSLPPSFIPSISPFSLSPSPILPFSSSAVVTTTAATVALSHHSSLPSPPFPPSLPPSLQAGISS